MINKNNTKNNNKFPFVREPQHDNGVDETPKEKYEEVSIYKIARQIRYNNVNVVSKFPKNDKYTIGKDISQAITDLMMCFVKTYKCNESYQKKFEYADKLVDSADLVLIQYRVLNDINIISKERYTQQIDLIISLIKQVTNWKNSLLKNAKEGKPLVVNK